MGTAAYGFIEIYAIINLLQLGGIQMAVKNTLCAAIAQFDIQLFQKEYNLSV